MCPEAQGRQFMRCTAKGVGARFAVVTSAASEIRRRSLVLVRRALLVVVPQLLPLLPRPAEDPPGQQPEVLVVGRDRGHVGVREPRGHGERAEIFRDASRIRALPVRESECRFAHA